MTTPTLLDVADALAAGDLMPVAMALTAAGLDVPDLWERAGRFDREAWVETLADRDESVASACLDAVLKRAGDDARAARATWSAAFDAALAELYRPPTLAELTAWLERRRPT